MTSPLPPVPDTRSALKWASAAAVATLGTAILWHTWLGINWPIWISAVAITLLLVARRRFGAVPLPTLYATYWAAAIALCLAITSEPGLAFLIVPASLSAIAVAIVMSDQRSLNALSTLHVFLAPFVAIGNVLSGLGRELTESSAITRSARRDSLLRSTLLTLPIVVALVLLLANADPLFAAVRDGAQTLLSIEEPGRIPFFLFLFAISIGAAGSVSRAVAKPLTLPASPHLVLGQTESRTIMGAMAATMWLFVASASRSLFENPASIAGSGITFADYAHRGFAELNIAATLVVGVILAARRSWSRDDERTWRIAGAGIGGVGAMLVIAFMRLLTYEQAYGFTYQRMWAQGYMLIVAVALGLLSYDAMCRRVSERFALHVGTAALTLVLASVYYNTDAWIVRRNIALYQHTHVLDVNYLTYELSHDATPELIASLPKLHEPERAQLEQRLTEKADVDSNRDARHWYAWNLRRWEADRALAQFTRRAASTPAILLPRQGAF